MKTKISMTTLLAIAIQVGSSGQNQDLPGYQRTNTNEKVVNRSKTNSPETARGSHQILAHLGPPVTTETHRGQTNSATQSTAELLRLSEELNRRAQILRQRASHESDRHKQVLLDEAANLDEKALLLQITVSQVHAELNLKSFQNNRINIQTLIKTWQGSELMLENSYELVADSEKEMKLARELREEAFAQPNPASVLGSLDNAEEKELSALHKQNQVITALSKSPALASNPN